MRIATSYYYSYYYYSYKVSGSATHVNLFKSTGKHLRVSRACAYAQRLQSDGQVLGLVVGHFGEWSPALAPLIKAMAEAAPPGVKRLFSVHGLQSAEEALTWKARRGIAWAGIKANAKLLLDRAE